MFMSALVLSTVFLKLLSGQGAAPDIREPAFHMFGEFLKLGTNYVVEWSGRFQKPATVTLTGQDIGKMSAISRVDGTGKNVFIFEMSPELFSNGFGTNFSGAGCAIGKAITMIAHESSNPERWTVTYFTSKNYFHGSYWFEGWKRIDDKVCDFVVIMRSGPERARGEVTIFVTKAGQVLGVSRG